MYRIGDGRILLDVPIMWILYCSSFITSYMEKETCARESFITGILIPNWSLQSSTVTERFEDRLKIGNILRNHFSRAFNLNK